MRNTNRTCCETLVVGSTGRRSAPYIIARRSTGSRALLIIRIQWKFRSLWRYRWLKQISTDTFAQLLQQDHFTNNEIARSRCPCAKTRGWWFQVTIVILRLLVELIVLIEATHSPESSQSPLYFFSWYYRTDVKKIKINQAIDYTDCKHTYKVARHRNPNHPRYRPLYFHLPVCNSNCYDRDCREGCSEISCRDPESVARRRFSEATARMDPLPEVELDIPICRWKKSLIRFFFSFLEFPDWFSIGVRYRKSFGRLSFTARWDSTCGTFYRCWCCLWCPCR